MMMNPPQPSTKHPSLPRRKNTGFPLQSKDRKMPRQYLQKRKARRKNPTWPKPKNVV